MEEKTETSGQLGPPLHPVYPSTDKLNNGGLGTRAVSKLIWTALDQVGQGIQESISYDVLQNYKLITSLSHLAGQ